MTTTQVDQARSVVLLAPPPSAEDEQAHEQQAEHQEELEQQEEHQGEIERIHDHQEDEHLVLAPPHAKLSSKRTRSGSVSVITNTDRRALSYRPHYTSRITDTNVLRATQLSALFCYRHASRFSTDDGTSD
ncbi:uncharacterized protein BKCO1_680002 [Diplodia corticola]|uniref:Uncharacterized protein n=1 Tax=Diplodia corticola TaxID=236234 RepID=A0A1J9RPZ1_9PEZI|nr:uncharacterized protein BKCO1_680002 [Diplodia corticola]OJD29980.1 hypothetical protein BKCO1_680002 [Diplodia corticola]